MSRPGTNAWYVRGERDPGSGLYEVHGYLGDRYPDGQVVDASPPDLAGAQRIWSAATDDEGRPTLSVAREVSAAAADLWFVLIPDRPRQPTSIDLVAFDTEHAPPGRVLDNLAFTVLPVRSADQVGAVRWAPPTGIVDQLYVDPGRRRQSLATAIVYAASAYHQANGWPGALRTDGRRTELGQRFVVGLRHPSRIDPWTDQAHPMDPDVAGR